MGQPIAVVEKQTARSGVVRFETNRVLTGMEHHRYPSRASATGNRPADELARRLFDLGGVDGVHIYSNIITVDLAKGGRSDGMADVIRELYTYYLPGVVPPSFEEEDAPAS
jgi:hypothetical protein